MSKFKKNKDGGTPAISTASLPDIVFMLLFFFMVTTVMRETTLLVKISQPKATEIAKLERKSLVSYIYVGKPIGRLASQFGTESRIQLNDAYANVEDLPAFVVSERESRDERERPLLTNSIKADKEVKMGIITDIKQELRKASAFKINYSTLKGVNE
jgi:biopolymer transport protein ExbD